MMKLKSAILIACYVSLFLPTGAFANGEQEQRSAAAPTVTIKLASLVPESTPWGEALNRIATEWSQITNGEVRVIVYHNGVQGGEGEVLQLLDQNQIQAAVLTSFGLNRISSEVLTLSCPFLIRNDTELDAVLAELKPKMEESINAHGYFTLAWSRAGWIRLFSKIPVFVPDDLRGQRLGSEPTEPQLMQTFKAMGFQLVPVSSLEVVGALTGGMIDVAYGSPISVGSMQIFGLANQMASLSLAPFMGGIVLNNRTWRQIPDQYKDDLIRSTKRIEAEMDVAIQELERSAIDTMLQYGLVVNQLSPAQEQLWYDLLDRAVPNLLGSTLNTNIYNQVNAIVQRQRAGH
jgi:TRAP-type C4-dicarboxylate transport system substrate-binding protein